MTAMKKVQRVLVVTGLFYCLGCGVKADPQPPLTPSDIGHGRPLYKGEEDSMPLLRKPLPPSESEQKDDQDVEDDK